MDLPYEIMSERRKAGRVAREALDNIAASSQAITDVLDAPHGTIHYHVDALIKEANNLVRCATTLDTLAGIARLIDRENN